MPCVVRGNRPIAAAMRRLLLAALIFLAVGPVPGTHFRYPQESFVEAAEARALDLPPATDGIIRFRRGWHLVSPHSRFGGFSALARLGPDRFQLVGDNGQWVRLEIGKDGRVESLRIAPLPRPAHWPKRKSMIDSEEMFVDPATGESWIALENINQIWRFDAAMTRVEARVQPAALKDWPRRRGPEAMARLADGRTLILSEGGYDDPRANHGLLMPGLPGERGKAVRFFYDSEGKGSTSAAAPLPDGRILLVHRDVGWNPVFTTELAIVDPADIKEGVVVRSRSIGRVPAAIAENYEGAAIAVVDGRTLLWLVADNNFQRWQRSLLVEFELAGLPDSKKAAR